MHHRPAGDVDVLGAAADDVGLLDRPLDPAASGGGEVRGQLLGVGEDQVPECSGTRGLRARLACGMVSAGSTSTSPSMEQRVQPRRSSRTTRAKSNSVGVEGRLARAVPRRVELGRLDPAGDQQQIIAAEARRVVDRPGGLRAIDLGHVRRDEAGHVPGRDLGHELLAQRRHPAAQLPNRPAPRHRMEVHPLIALQINQDQPHTPESPIRRRSTRCVRRQKCRGETTHHLLFTVPRSSLIIHLSPSRRLRASGRLA